MPFYGATATTALDGAVAKCPVGGTWRLYSDMPIDPETGVFDATTELPADGGYAPVAADPSDWAAAVDESVATAAPVDMGTSTDAWPETANYWAYCDSAGVPALWDELLEEIAVEDPGTPVSFTPTVMWDPEQ